MSLLLSGGNLAMDMHAESQSTRIGRSWVAIVLILKDKRAIVFRKKGVKLPAISKRFSLLSV